jgi:HPt (histidine-containing phosphotransfer) domain-containing protein
MDCQMPEMDGYEVSLAIRQTLPASGAPYIIALTANALQGDRERCLQAGMNDYLTKPLQISDLENTLQRALLRVQPVRRPRETGTGFDAETLDAGILAGLRELRSPQQPDPLQELVDLFLRDARVRLQKLALAVDAKDCGALASTAHTLKGSANNLGARRLASFLANLENYGKTGNLTDSANILLNVRSEFHEVEKALLAEVQK